MYSKETIKTQKRYDRFAVIYDFIESALENKFFSRLRKETFNNIHGKVLEIGVGTGKNLPYYNKNTEVIGVDISPGMLKRAKKRAKKLNIKPQLVLMDAHQLKFKDNQFDYVIGTFVLCSIPDPVKALEEVKRVLKTNGKVIFIEHVLSKHKLLAIFQHLHNPLTRWLFGFNVNRDTRKNIEKARLKIKEDEVLGFFDVFRRFTCSKK